MIRYVILIVSVLSILLSITVSYGAQSTADVPLTSEQIATARQKVLGSQAAQSRAAKEYTIGHGDVLSVQVYGEGDMSIATPSRTRNAPGSDALRMAVGGVNVRIDGRISLKHLGDIEAVGFTLTQLADYLKELYASVYDEPIVTVVLAQSNSQRYTVMGKVARPGIYYLDYPINLVQVVARCGGFTEWAKSEVSLVRKKVGYNKRLFKKNKLSFDYEEFLDGDKIEKNVLIEPGDIIIVN